MWQLLRSSLIPRLRGNVSLLPCGLGTKLIQVMPLSGINRGSLAEPDSHTKEESGSVRLKYIALYGIPVPKLNEWF